MLATRGQVTGVVARGMAVGAALTTVLLLAACGHNDSTASSTPTLSTSTSAVATPPPPSSSTGPVQSPPPPPAPPTTAAERPQPAPPVNPNPTTKITPKGQAFLDEIRQHGLSPTPDVAIPTADFICQSKTQNMPPDQITTYVNAMVGSDPAFDPQKMPVGQAGQIYIDAANQTYCSK